MGPNSKQKRMRVLFSVCTIALLAGAFAVTEEESFVEAQQSIQDMKKKGATEADCKDLAKTTCKEVLGEVSKDQKVINSQSSGIHCNKLGGGAVTVAIRHYHKRLTQWKVARKKIVTASSTKVTIASQSYRSLRSGKCGWVFSSTSYRTALSIYTKAVRHERTVRGWVTEAKRQIEIARRTQRIMQEKCRCNVKKRRDTIWRTINNAKKRSRQLKALQKCKMMQCVLAGTSLKSSKCRAHLPALRNKKLYYKVEKISTRVCAAHHRENHVKVTGERRSKAKARERKHKERQHKEQKNKAHERRSKAAERASKERTGKLERANKHKAALARRIHASHHRWLGNINGWDGHMNWHTNGHTYVSGLQSWHHNGYEDRIFRPLVTNIGSTQHGRHITGFVNNMDGTFAYTCPTNKAIVGFYSYHNNGNEDRRWRFYCAHFHGVGFRAGGWPGWQTRMDAHFAIGCGHNPAIGFSSYHNNHKEDRVWRIRCGHRYALRV